MKPLRLSKSSYLSYLRCPNEFWLEVNQPLFIPQAYSLEYEHLRQQGYAVQQYAKDLGLFKPDGLTAIDFERAFQTKDLYSRSDIVVTDPSTGVLDIYEVKAAGSVKDEYLDDVAFQRLAAERSGSAVGRCFVITMNGEYIRRGDIDVEEMFVVTDVTDQVADRIPATEEQIKQAFAYLRSVPTPSLADYCMANRGDCEFIKLHFPDLPEYSVFDIVRLTHEKRRELLLQDVISIMDVPEDFPLSSKQREQVNAAKSGAVLIDIKRIADRMKKWEYPLHFLDYETFAYAIPQFDGVKPFQQMCFQYSLHTVDKPGAEMRHTYFLSDGQGDPPRILSEHLREAMSGGIGTVLVWYDPFEKGRNAEMAEMFPEFADFYNEVNSKTVDLMKIFSDNLYIHPGFKGRSSIKKVLPVLVPELSYTALGIGDGMTATISWFRAVKWEAMGAGTREKIFHDLEVYCEQDTLAMVRIFEVLQAGLS